MACTTRKHVAVSPCRQGGREHSGSRTQRIRSPGGAFSRHGVPGDRSRALPLAIPARIPANVVNNDDTPAGAARMIDDAALLHIIHGITRCVELVGIAVILAGALYSAIRFAGDVARYRTVPHDAAARRSDPYKQLRSNLGRSILLGLELLVAGDIINTVAVEPTLRSLAVLAGIVLIRTFLSVSLEVEIEGRWPWQAPRAERTPADGPRDQA